jgi:prepilin-type N-terminal cleavage/methylation domain-containing protein
MRKQKQGFTLVEILVTVSILAIGAMTTIPLINSTNTDLQVSAASRTLMSDLLYAQSYAMTHQVNVHLVFTLGSGSVADQYQLQYYDSATSTYQPLNRPAGASSIATFGTGGTMPNVKLSALPVSPFTAGFDSLGQPLQSNDTIYTASYSIGVQSTVNATTNTLTIQPYTGEITIQ